MNVFKRMGSASSSVGSVQTLSGFSSRPSSTKSTKISKQNELKNLTEQVTNLQVLLDQSRNSNIAFQTQTETLKQRTEELERENETLIEHNQSLQAQLETLEDGAIVEDPYDTSESIKLKEIEILKLQSELQAYADENQALKQKFKTKLKSVKTNYARSKQEQSLKIFELKDEVLALQQENEQLKEKLADLGQEEVSFIDKPSNLVDNRSNIIIELSTQISEQENRISELESQLQEKDFIISKLQSAPLSPREAQSIISVEADKASQEMLTLAKELKMLKRKKKKAKADLLNTESDYNRQLSSLSRDSGALDLITPTSSNHDQAMKSKVSGDHTDILSFINPHQSATSFSSSSTLVS